MDAPEELDVHTHDHGFVCRLTPRRSRSADEAVGFFLTPILVASTTSATAYVLVYLAVALTGADPAIVLVPWRSAFVWAAVLLWLGSTAAMWRSAPTVLSRAELKLDQDSVTLMGTTGVSGYALYSELQSAVVLVDGTLRIQLARRDGEPMIVPMAGNTEKAARWLAGALQERIT